MIAFDADVLSDILAGNPDLARRAAEVPAAEQWVPIVVVEEIVRGRLNSIRQAEAGKSKLGIERAYGLLEETLDVFQNISILSYTAQAHELFKAWRQMKRSIGTHDLRIAAICVAHSITLVTRNQRDFARVVELDLDVWN